MACLAINSDHKFGKSLNETKLPVKYSYNKTLPEYILNKPKTGWSAPITAWLGKFDSIKNKYIDTCSKEDGISQILSKENYTGNPKKMIITWMLRSWAQQYNMTL